MTTPTSQQSQPLPQTAQQRLAQSQQGHPCFTSDLSVNEFVLSTQAGFEPLGLVMGTCIYHIGMQVSRWSVSQELPVLTQAMYSARELAMARMESEADALGADGIIGVQLRPCQFAFSLDVLEFVAIGTAIKFTGGQSFRNQAGRPFTSDLSGQDFWTLWQHGWLPRALVMGTCVYHVAHMSFRQVLANAGQNAELGIYSQAVYDAREIAMTRMQYEGQQMGADGIVGVRVQEASWIWGEHAIEYLAIGTAVNRVRPDAAPVTPTMTLPLVG
jgi:uncharacterized protein YbjQ (UPF0145 family)